MAAGKIRSAYDMLVAATAAATNRVLLTTDASAGFGELAGVRCEVLSTR
jgi:predicted nucleic acid-binding protein